MDSKTALDGKIALTNSTFAWSSLTAADNKMVPVAASFPGAAAIEYFMHARLRADPDLLYRSRVLIALLLCFSVLLILACIANQITISTRQDHLINLALTASLLLGNAALLTILRLRGSYFFCAAAALLSIIGASVVSIAVSGGVWMSAVPLLLAVPVLMGYYFGGVRWGNYSIVLTGAIVLSFLVLDYAGIRFPQTMGKGTLLIVTQMIVSLICVCTVATLAFIYEFTATTLKRERDRNHRKAVALAQTDVLTGLVNRRSFDAHLQQRIEAFGSARAPAPLVLCYLDLDAFKSINDRYGHAVGDEVLQSVAERLHAAVRGSDIVGRHGGDEFMILFDSLHTSDDVHGMAQRALASIREPIRTSAGPLSVGASLGFAVFPRDADTLEGLKKVADSAMYIAKRDGGGWRSGISDAGAAAPQFATPEQSAQKQSQLAHQRPSQQLFQQSVPQLSWSAPARNSVSQTLAAPPAHETEQARRGLARLIEYFVHPSLRLEADVLYRSRILIMALLLMLAVIASGCIVVAVSALPVPAKTANLSITVSVILIIAFLLEKLRRSGDYIFCGTAMVLVLLVCNFVGIAVSGGIASAPATALMAVPALLAFFFGGLRRGSYVTFIAVLCIAVLPLIELTDWRFPNTSVPADAAFNQLLVNIMGLTVMFGMAFIYEFTTSTLMRERDAEHRKIARLAYTDALTGLANRLDFDTELELRIARYNAAISRSCFALCLLDLDGFKPVNDAFGHDIGDEVLQIISERLRGCLRDSDYVGRQGGDEFMLIFDGVDTTTQVDIFARRMLQMIELPIATSAGSVTVSGSLGFAMFPSGAGDIAALKNAADRAMYAAKRSRSGWHIDPH